MAELEEEMRNYQDLKDAKKDKEKKEIVLKIKIPNCRYRHEVFYKRGKFEFIYQYDFFLHYFDHRYFHKKKFYDLYDSTRIIARDVIKIVGNSDYLVSDFNSPKRLVSNS